MEWILYIWLWIVSAAFLFSAAAVAVILLGAFIYYLVRSVFLDKEKAR